MKRIFLSLSILTLLSLLALWLFAPGDEALDIPEDDSLLLSGISDQINDVSRVEIVIAGNDVVATLLKTGDSWQLEQMGGYRADWPRLRKLLSALAQARVVESKTAKPEYYERLGVEDVVAEDAGSVLVRIGIGDQITGVLVGHRSQGRPGQYVRLQNAAASALVDREIDVSIQSLDWVESTIVDINASEVAEVEVIHPQGERLLVTRISADQTDFDLVGIPEDREIKSSWAVNSLASVFSLLSLETVRSAADTDWDKAVKMRLLTFTGVEIMTDLIHTGDDYLIRLNASHPAANVAAKESNDSAEQQEIEQRAADDIAKTVEEINQKTAGWAYGISKSKYDAMVRKPEDLFKPLDAP
jgi:hypothetical protein